MSATERHIEVFDKYINNDLSPKLRDAFEAKLANDPIMRESFELHLAMVSGLKEEGRRILKNDLVDIGLSLSSAEVKKYQTRTTRIIKKVFVIVTVVAIVGAAYWYSQNAILFGGEGGTVPIELKEIVPEAPPVEKENNVLEVIIPAIDVPDTTESIEYIHDTIYIIDHDTIYLDQEEADERIKNGTYIVDTVYDVQIDTVMIQDE